MTVSVPLISPKDTKKNKARHPAYYLKIAVKSVSLLTKTVIELCQSRALCA